MPLLEEPSSHSPSMELRLSLRKWCPINGGVMRGFKMNNKKGMHTVKETYMLAAKIDPLIKRLDERADEKEAIYGTVKAMDLHMTCEVCGESGHLENDCPETREDDTYINNGFGPQGGNNGGTINHVHHSKKVI